MREGIIITKDTYVKLIKSDIEALDNYMPEHSKEKRHIKMVLQWSIEKEFPAEYWDKKKICLECGGDGYNYFSNQGEPDLDSKCSTCKGTGEVLDVPPPPYTKSIIYVDYVNGKVLDVPPPPPPRLLRESGKSIWEIIAEWRHRHDKK